jgi:hypothetical protein
MSYAKAVQAGDGLWRRFVITDVYVFGLHAPPEPFDEDTVPRPVSPIHCCLRYRSVFKPNMFAVLHIHGPPPIIGRFNALTLHRVVHPGGRPLIAFIKLSVLAVICVLKS